MRAAGREGVEKTGAGARERQKLKGESSARNCKCERGTWVAGCPQGVQESKRALPSNLGPMLLHSKLHTPQCTTARTTMATISFPLGPMV